MNRIRSPIRQLVIELSIVLPLLTVVGLACISVCYFANGVDEARASLAGMLTTFPAAVFVVLFVSRFGTGAPVVIAVTFVRVGLTMALAGYLAWKFSSLRTLSFFMTVTVVYLAGLLVETWLAVKKNSTKSDSQ